MRFLIRIWAHSLGSGPRPIRLPNKAITHSRRPLRCSAYFTNSSNCCLPCLKSKANFSDSVSPFPLPHIPATHMPPQIHRTLVQSNRRRARTILKLDEQGIPSLAKTSISPQKAIPCFCANSRVCRMGLCKHERNVLNRAVEVGVQAMVAHQAYVVLYRYTFARQTVPFRLRERKASLERHKRMEPVLVSKWSRES